MNWDVFISHAGEDKEDIARPLAKALSEASLAVWYDEFTLRLGDRLRRSIERGLQNSKYGIVILSHNFFAKEWPQSELDGLATQEYEGRKKILPIWHNVTRNDVVKYSPMLADRLAVSTSKGLGHVVNRILELFNVEVLPSVDLSTTVLPKLVLSDPFMIASSHWTASENSFKQLARIRPSAVTLKTTSKKYGGDGRGQRDLQKLQNHFGSPFAMYTDAPRTVELWDVASTFTYTQLARNTLTDSALGLSILQDEDYADIAKSLDMKHYSYVELNWKYTYRQISKKNSTQSLSRILGDLEYFLNAFINIPCLIKLSRSLAEKSRDP